MKLVSTTLLPSLFLYSLGVILLPARPIQVWTNEQLTEKSQVVCVGTVVKIVATGRKYLSPFQPDRPDRGHTMIATVKVTRLIKGSMPSVIQIRYPQVEALLMNGFVQIDLEENKRYFFYLNPVAGKKWYVGALDDQSDDGAAIQPLYPDPAPPLPPIAPSASHSGVPPLARPIALPR